ncbi:MAG: 50S ribosomal protein L21 [Chloroflexi bacterium]|jgi:large subunit ribosomal protein L21|nr:50S ribosomal protein L21 [Chloroflexota bacterium]
MYAVIETGGKQYRVEVGTELEVELLDVEVGSEISLDRVLLVADGDTAAIGRPTVENATVRAEVVRRGRGEKVISFKYRPKARRRVKKGHRQDHLVLRIADITLDGKSAAAAVAAKSDAKKAERAKVEEAAARQAAEDAALAAKLAEKAKAAEAGESEAPARKARATKKAAGAAADEDPGATAASADEADAPATAEADAAATDESEAPAPKRSRTKKDA